LKRVALKFCGGCDPEYDRIAYCEKLHITAGDRIEWARPDDNGCHAALLICGCPRACPENDLASTYPRCIISITDDEEDSEEVIKKLMTIAT